MADFKLTKRETESQQNKGQISTQAYLGNTTRTVTTTPPAYTEARTQQGTAVKEATVTKGNVRETRTTTGVGKTGLQLEDKGVVLKFKIPIQQRNPVARVP